jgi:hypothetical protein
MDNHLVHVCKKENTEMDSPKNLKKDTEGKWGLNCIKTNGGFRGTYLQ